MLKVLIADDEEKVCQLIKKLVDWEELGMEVVAEAHNGIEALEMIEKYNPDIAITDIRMPGYDGLEMIRRAKEISTLLEFVIISGYRHFEYAQSAIKYGVSDYLLKPIKKQELMSTLFKLKEHYLQRTEQLTFEEKVLLSLKNDVGRLRTSYFAKILYQAEKGNDCGNILETNNEYHYKMKEGCFQIISIKLDGIGESYNSNMEFLTDKITQIVKTFLSQLCYDYELYFENSRSYVLLNFAAINKKAVRKQLKFILDELIVQESVLEGMKVTIGTGRIADDLNGLKTSLKFAVWAIEQRLILGTEKVIEGEESESTGLADSALFYDFNKKMSAALERLDSKEVESAIKGLKTDLLSREGITGHEILQMTKEVCNLYLFFMRNNHIVISRAEHFMEEYNLHANGYDTVNSLFTYLIELIVNSMNQAAEEKRQTDNRPIRIAKQYMQENFSSTISLDEVSAAAGFNATYFSSLFKKETGSTFTEYLSNMRMDAAKNFLKETNMSVAFVCEKVGYNDVKHFTKSFIKYTGLKPNEYRKLYS